MLMPPPPPPQVLSSKRGREGTLLLPSCTKTNEHNLVLVSGVWVALWTGAKKLGHKLLLLEGKTERGRGRERERERKKLKMS
jgi:hypothetical protein